MKIVPAFYQPTTVLILDDDITFARLLEARLPRENRYRIFDQPEQASRFWDDDVDASMPQGEDTRHAHVSTAIVDYTLADKDGLDVCRSIKSRLVKKIMISSFLPVDSAQSAQNRRDIDFFFSKTSKNFIAEVSAAVDHSKLEYFTELSLSLPEFCARDNPLTDPVFVDYFQELTKTNDVVEYQSLRAGDYTSFMLRSRQRKITHLLLSTDAGVDNLLDTVHADTAPAYLLEQIRSRERMPCFSSTTFPRGEEWELHMRPSHMLCGRQKYFVVHTRPIAPKWDMGSTVMDWETTRSHSTKHIATRCNIDQLDAT